MQPARTIPSPRCFHAFSGSAKRSRCRKTPVLTWPNVIPRTWGKTTKAAKAPTARLTMDRKSFENSVSRTALRSESNANPSAGVATVTATG